MFIATGPVNPGALVDAALRPVADVLPSGAIRHHFAGQGDAKGVYAKETHIPAGVTLVQHRHEYDHLSVIGNGIVGVTINGEQKVWRGPAAITIRKGETHTVLAITDTVWFCIHPTDCTDAALVDEVILAKPD